MIGHGGKRHVVRSWAMLTDGRYASKALNNLGHSNQRVVIVLNDNGRSYAPTISKLSESLTSLRLNKTYLTLRGACVAPCRTFRKSVRRPISHRRLTSVRA